MAWLNKSYAHKALNYDLMKQHWQIGRLEFSGFVDASPLFVINYTIG